MMYMIIIVKLKGDEHDVGRVLVARDKKTARSVIFVLIWSDMEDLERKKKVACFANVQAT